MIKTLIDTNIILDIALSRQPFCQEAGIIFQYIEDKKIRGYISASAITDIFYLLRKQIGRQNATQCILDLIKIVDILGVDKETIVNALLFGWTDFEDAVQAQVAIENEIEVIVTRNTKDFKQLIPIKIFTPTELIELVHSKMLEVLEKRG
jgi:predicted nucleic acid-binding protein